MEFSVKLVFRDNLTHFIETIDIEEARSYLEQVYNGLSSKERKFRMLNKANQLVYVCNMDNFVHAMIVRVAPKPTSVKTVDMV